MVRKSFGAEVGYGLVVVRMEVLGPWIGSYLYKVAVLRQLLIGVRQQRAILATVLAGKLQGAAEKMTPPEKSANGKNIFLSKVSWVIQHQIG